MTRTGKMERRTKETTITAVVTLDERGVADVSTGIGFLDHMVTALSRHSAISITLHCSGDLEVDDHHTAEDCAIAVGRALEQALGDRSGIRRFGSAYAPLDEALARAVIDLSGRPSPHIEFGFRREMLGTIATENLTHFVDTLALELRASIHLDLLKGKNDHHRAEAGFKALALALRDAVEPRGSGVPSTKGVLG